MTWVYDAFAVLCRPSFWWGRASVEGLEHVPDTGPLLIVPNHDSQWDPIIVGLAIKPKRRLRFLARADLWKIPGIGLLLDAMGQIPIKRGGGDGRALDRTVESLRAGDAVCVFPEGRLSWGERIRARTGVGLLAAWCPESRAVLCAMEGTTEYVRFPRRPRVRIRFLAPPGGQRRPDESPTELATRLLFELRQVVPPAPAGRRGIVGVPPRVQKMYERQNAHSGGNGSPGGQAVE
ncbi:MAG: lysophospholipid acyltransferase family protein [Acidobacteria bacterium]|nr:lysophospholipid acyltransferase family protein [Acidobacteriota bacterium]